MNRLTHIVLVCFLFWGCTTSEDAASKNTFNLYKYYLDNEMYAYEITAPVVLTTTIPPLSLSCSDCWTYYNFRRSFTEVANGSWEPEYTIQRIIGNSVLCFIKKDYTFDTTFSYDTVRFNGTMVTQWKSDTGWIDTFHYKFEEFPLDFKNVSSESIRGIIMDDTTVWYRDRNKIYSSKLGRVVDYDKYGYSSILFRKNGERVDIGYQLHEFLAKEKHLAF